MGEEQPLFEEERIDRTPYAACIAVVVFGIGLFWIGSTLILRSSQSAVHSFRSYFSAIQLGGSGKDVQSSVDTAANSAQEALDKAKAAAQKAAVDAASNAVKDATKSATDSLTNEAKKQVDTLGNSINSIAK